MASIRIVSVPPGEAPQVVREAWVGLELPLASGGDRQTWRGFGVLSGPKRWYAILVALIGGKAEIIDGYAVESAAAIAILSETQPTAAQWWETNTPRFLKPGHRFVFHAEACELVP